MWLRHTSMTIHIVLICLEPLLCSYLLGKVTFFKPANGLINLLPCSCCWLIVFWHAVLASWMLVPFFYHRCNAIAHRHWYNLGYSTGSYKVKECVDYSVGRAGQRFWILENKSNKLEKRTTKGWLSTEILFALLTLVRLLWSLIEALV